METTCTQHTSDVRDLGWPDDAAESPPKAQKWTFSC